MIEPKFSKNSYLALLVFSFLFSKVSFSQNKSDSLFLNYLVENNQHREIITLINSFKLTDSSKFHINNNLFFRKGIAFYNLKSLDSASNYLSKINAENPNYIEAKLFDGVLNSYLGKYNLAESVFSNLKSNDSLILATRNFELASLSLLSRNFNQIDSQTSYFSDKYYQLVKQQTNLLQHNSVIRKFNRKSPFKAGLLSAIVPGLGKLYVGGQLGQGISAFIQNAVFGVQAIEAYKKAGPRSARFIIYGGLFSVFYLGNIWGSALSVSIKRQEFNEKINDQILFDMHIPLRALYN